MVNSIALLILLSSVNAQQVRGLANAETDERRSLIETYDQARITTKEPETRKLGSIWDDTGNHSLTCNKRASSFKNKKSCEKCGHDWHKKKWSFFRCYEGFAFGR